jgi:multidrug efflux pump
LRHQFLVLCILLATVGLNFYLFAVVPKGFFPQQDTGMLSGVAQGSEDISFQSMSAKLLKFIQVVKSDPAVEHVIGSTGGGGGGNPTDQGRLFVTLKPLGQRTNSADQVVARLRRECARVSGATCIFSANQDLRVGGRMSSAQYQYTIQSDTLQDLVKWAPILMEKMKKIPGVADVNSDLQNEGLESSLVYDRPTAMRLGLTAANLDSALYGAFGQSLVSTMYTSLNQYYVVMEVAPRWWQSPAGLSAIYLQATNGGEVPLSAVTSLRTQTAPIQVNHQGQFPAVTISFNLAPGVSLSEAVTSITAIQQELGMPASIHGSFAGTLQAYQSSVAGEPFLIVTALLAVYIVLGILYESYIHPVTILSTLPSAGVGAVVFLMLFHIDLSIIALIGVILLIGIVKKNGILMVDFAIEAERKEGKSPEEAIYQASILRFRPILMTTLAATCGALPLVLSHGTGSELRRPLGVAIVGGLLFSQVLTLYTTPVVYLYFDRMSIWYRRVRGKSQTAETAPQPVPA